MCDLDTNPISLFYMYELTSRLFLFIILDVISVKIQCCINTKSCVVCFEIICWDVFILTFFIILVV